ncbi:hypothetical protein Dsin_029956 [Dipteronia sinensis]|uniref:F-box domain-containing protein n=1 Tax=Dipteronia sinensis TaxID=43782 RepID=A0AAD9ZJM8_9ROSI|nr:hypothetical protein Dsin_029956 [Dipteronia sinensis]
MLLPELIIEILSILPVKSLCRFRCVSKLLLALIKDTRFINMHLATTQRKRLVLETVEFRRELRGRKLKFINAMCLFSVDLETLSENEDKIFSVELDFTKPIPKLEFLWCLSSCNGLLCLLNGRRDCFLYNPSIQESKQIPDFHMRQLLPFGFGYAESIDDYKFVKVNHSRKRLDVYSLRNDSWTSIQIHLLYKDYKSFIAKCSRSGVFLNEVIHWVSKDVKGSFMIAVFDLVQEKFKTLPPPYIIPNNNCMYCLGILSGCLCLTVEISHFNIQVWIMKEYGMKGSWTRILICASFYWLKPLWYSNNSETMLILSDTREFVFCNTKDGKCKSIEVHGMRKRLDGITYDQVLDIGDEGEVEVYVESLVSPNYTNDFTTKGN